MALFFARGVKLKGVNHHVLVSPDTPKKFL